jgi:hypothetical protein
MFKEIHSIASLKFNHIRRTPLNIFLQFIFAATPFLFVFFYNVKGLPLVEACIGGMIAGIPASTILMIFQMLSADRESKFRDMIIGTPVKPISYSLGVSIANFPVMIPNILIFGVILGFMGYFTIITALITILLLIFLWISMCTVGFMLGKLMKNMTMATIGAVSNLLFGILIYLPPVYYSEYRLGSFHYLGWLVPTSNVASIIKIILKIQEDIPGTIIYRVFILILITAISLVIAMQQKWREV